MPGLFADAEGARVNARRSSTRLSPEISGSVFSNPSALIGSLLFGAVGFVAFVYGKKMALWKPMVIGVVLMVYPYFVPQTWLMYTIGCALCLGLYVFRG